MDTTRISPLYRTAPQGSNHSLPAGLRAETKALSDHAYVTLVTNPDYLPGAEALLRSLKLTGTRADLVVMHRGLGPAHLARLSANLNQLARLANSGEPVTVADALLQRLAGEVGRLRLALLGAGGRE